MRHINIFLYLLLVTASHFYGQSLQEYERTMQDTQEFLFKIKNDHKKDSANAVFLQTMEKALGLERSFEYPFDSLGHIGIVTSPDKKFRIINWNLAYSKGGHSYFGFMQVLNAETKQYNLIKLKDISDEVRKPETTAGEPDKWFGMLYYSVILTKHKKKTYYTLLGWDGNNSVSAKKIIDVLTFTADNKPRFGEMIFSMPKKNPRRVIFEYNADAVMLLRYDKELNMIVFDHLSPRDPSLAGQYQFYGPDFTYDGFKFVKGKWVYSENVDARNTKDKTDKYYLDPRSNDRKPARNLMDTTKTRKGG